MTHHSTSDSTWHRQHPKPTTPPYHVYSLSTKFVLLSHSRTFLLLALALVGSALLLASAANSSVPPSYLYEIEDLHRDMKIHQTLLTGLLLLALLQPSDAGTTKAVEERWVPSNHEGTAIHREAIGGRDDVLNHPDGTDAESLRRRRLPGGADYGFDFGDMEQAELGFLAGMLFFVALICFLICCCCGGCSLWDIVALVCLWELCCDRNGASLASAGDFVLV